MLAHSHVQDYIFKQAAAAATSLQVKRSAPLTVELPVPKRNTNQAGARCSTSGTHSLGEIITVKAANGLSFQVPKFAADWFTPHITGKRTEAIYKQHLGTHDKVFKDVFKRVCRNCWTAGRGTFVHTYTECMAAGNDCVLQCPTCKEGKHWASRCPGKSKKSSFCDLTPRRPSHLQWMIS